MIRLDWVAAWVFGVVLSFALPVAPAFYIWCVLAVAMLPLLWRWRRYRAACWAYAFYIGMAYAVCFTQLQLKQQWPLTQIEPVLVQIRVADLPQTDERRVRFEAEVQDDNGRSLRVLLSDYALREWPVGSVWHVQAKLRTPIGEVNLSGFNREAWALNNGLAGLGTIGKFREQILPAQRYGLLSTRNLISRHWQRVEQYKDGAALMRALSVGEQSALSSEAWQAFRPLGLNHLVSISGLHVSMVALWAAWLMKRAMKWWPRMPARPRIWILLTGLAAALFYALLAGFSVPTQRSVLMLFVLAWVWLGRRSSSAWYAWWLSLAAVLLFAPSAVLGAGLWLSFGLVAALIWVSALRVGEHGRAVAPWRLALRAQVAISIWSLVLLGTWFGSLPLLSPLVNVVAIPWFSWVLTPLALAASAIPWLPLQTMAAALADYTIKILIWLANYAPEFGVSAAPWPLLILAVFASMVLVWPKGSGLKPWALLMLMAFLLYRPASPLPNRARVTVWDVGQGSAMLVQTSKHNLLFDTGHLATAYMTLLPNLHAVGVNRLDALVLSHHDNDHDGGFVPVAATMKPKVILAGQPEVYPNAQKCVEQAWMWDGVLFEWLTADALKLDDDNEQSCVLRVLAGGQSILVTGDLGQKGEKALLARYGNALMSQVLILGHHGSTSSSSGGFLNTVAPDYAVASSGYANQYGHPTAAVQSRVRAHEIKLLRTDYSGGMVFELGGNDKIFAGYLNKTKPYWQRKPFAENK